MGERHAEDHRLVHRPALEAAGHALPAREHFLDDQRERQRGDRQVDAGHSQRRQPHQHAGGRGQHDGQRQRHQPRQAEALREVHVGVGADAEERGVAEADEPGVAGQHHERETADGVDQDQAHVHQVVRDQPRQHHEASGERDVAVALDVVAEQPEVLRVRRLEDEPHRRLRPSCGPRCRTSPGAAPPARAGARRRRRRP